MESMEKEKTVIGIIASIYEVTMKKDGKMIASY